MARPGVIGGDPPCPSARGRGQPHVVIRDKGDDVAVNMRETQVPG